MSVALFCQQPTRPWLSLYNNRLTVPGAESMHEAHEALAPIQRFPQELIIMVLGHLDPYDLPKVALTCRQMRMLCEHQRLWAHACHDAFALSLPDRAEVHKLLATQYRFSYKRMFVHHPHLRFAGVYVGRNTYVRTGVAEFTQHKPVHLVTYFRYFRFLPDGTLLYRTSPLTVSRVAKAMAAAGAGGGAAGRPPGGKEADRGPLFAGRYAIKDQRILVAVTYPNSSSTELRMRLSLRSSRPGAHDRLDVESIVTYDRETGQEASLAPPPLDADAEAPAAARAHSRGMAPCVFVPWHDVAASPLNLPPHQMDFMIV